MSNPQAEIETSRDALLAQWALIPETTRTEALAGGWYRESRRLARSLARRHHVKVSQAAGVIAALSPRITWAENVRGAEAILADPIDGRSGGYPTNVAKARRIALGEHPGAVLGGVKVLAFFRAIMGDSDAAVVDVWMLRAAGRYSKTRAGAEHHDVTPALVRLVAEAMRQAAREAGVPVATFQALVWTHIRGSAT